MAKGPSLLLNGLSGSVGGFTVVSQPDGEVILKQKITRMTNPNTVYQKMQRLKMSAAMQFVRKNTDAINQLGIKRLGRKSAVNQITSHLLKDVIDTNTGAAVFHLEQFTPSLATQIAPYSASVNSAGFDATRDAITAEVEVVVDNNAASADTSDRLIAVIVYKFDNRMKVIDLGAIGSNVTATPVGFEGYSKECVMYFHTFNHSTKHVKAIDLAISFDNNGTML